MNNERDTNYLFAIHRAYLGHGACVRGRIDSLNGGICGLH